MSTDPRLRNLFVEGLRLVHAAHHQDAEQAKDNAGSASLSKLGRMLESGAEADLAQARRLEPIFKSLGRDVENRTDRAMAGIVDAGKTQVAKAENRATRDLAIIGGRHVAAHYFVATYGTLRAYARALGLREAASVCDRTLAEIGKADRDLSALAVRIASRVDDRSYSSESALHTTAALHPARTAATGFALVAAGAVALVALAPPPAPAPRGVRRLWSR